MRIPSTKIVASVIDFTGGLDVVTPAIKANPGTCRDSQNFVEDIDGGYYTLPGYERYDGRVKPSDAQYAMLEISVPEAVGQDFMVVDGGGFDFFNVTDDGGEAFEVLEGGSGVVSVGDILTDDAESTYGTVIALFSEEVDTGEAITQDFMVADGDGFDVFNVTEGGGESFLTQEGGSGVVTVTYAVLTKITGIFSTGNIRIGSAVIGTCVGSQIVDGASTTKLHAQYKNLAADEYRGDILAVPGSGSILGIKSYKDVQYAFRNNAGATAVDIYQNTASGWSQLPLGKELSFTSGGTYEVAEGDEIEGETSGAKATITRVANESGTFAAGTAAGRFIFASQTGTFQSETIKVGANGNVATLSADSSDITLPVIDGRFEFKVANFGGSANTSRLYGCDGKNRGFEFDGTVFVPIETGMTNDNPEHVRTHKNHLFYSFLGSVQHSSIGNPYQWTPLTGASELAMGDTVTGFMEQPGSFETAALAIFTRNSIGILYGSGSEDWNLTHYQQEAGALAHTIQSMGGTLMLDDRGVVSLSTSTAYGNFADAVLSKKIKSWLKTKVPVSSCVLRDRNQYCLYFTDNTGMYITKDNKKIKGMMPVALGHTVKCIDSYETTGGDEEVYFGDENGYVHQMEKGTSFDGGDIEARLTFAFNHFKSPTVIKRFRKSILEISGNGYHELGCGYDLDYLSLEREQPVSVTEIKSLTAARWDAATTIWDSAGFVWDGISLSPSYLDMTGSGVNMSLKIESRSDYFNPITIANAIIEYTPTRNKR